MTTEEIIIAIENATNKTFISGMASRTCMGWEQEYDNKGRPLRADPNYTSSKIKIDGVTYALVRKGWKAYVFKPEYPDANYLWLWKENRDNYLLAEIDQTPAYVKEYYQKKED